MVQPKFLSDVLRRRIPGTSESQSNRNSRQRSDSVSSSVTGHSTSRSNSQKRKQDDVTEQNLGSYASVAGGYSKLEPILSPAQVSGVEELLKKVREDSGRLNSTLANFDLSPEFKECLKSITDMIGALTLSQEVMLTALKNKKTQAEPAISFDYAVAAQKVQRMDPTVAGSGSGGGSGGSSTTWKAPQQSGEKTKDQEPEENSREAKLRKFRKEVEEAERSTLVLNLDLGRTRIINEDTISTNVSKALTAMAAKVEDRRSGIPSDDAIEAIDDVISVAKKMSFFGKSTKSVRNTKNAELNGSYMTIPVKYEFRDRDTKFFADEVLRKTCNAQLSVPYPTILREGIKQIVENHKKKYPDHLIKVLVDTRKMVFKTSRRLTKTSEWIKFPTEIPIPEACLDVGARDVPDGFKIPWPPDPDDDTGGGTWRAPRIEIQTPPGAKTAPMGNFSLFPSKHTVLALMGNTIIYPATCMAKRSDPTYKVNYTHYYEISKRRKKEINKGIIIEYGYGLRVNCKHTRILLQYTQYGDHDPKTGYWPGVSLCTRNVVMTWRLASPPPPTSPRLNSRVYSQSSDSRRAINNTVNQDIWCTLAVTYLITLP